jgi:hypothetical protein
MDWMKERDLLIAQTIAFVQSVTGKKPDPALLTSARETAKPAAATAMMVKAEAEPADTAPATRISKPIEVPQPEAPSLPELNGDFQSEIRARVANFRAHQERFLRERAEYCSATMAKVRASLDENTDPPRPAK